MSKPFVSQNKPSIDEGRLMHGVPGRGDLKPINLRLWALVVQRARMKFHPYPSPGASHWVHKTYVEMGGRFLASDDPRYKKLMAKEHESERHANAKAGIPEEKKSKKQKK